MFFSISFLFLLLCSTRGFALNLVPLSDDGGLERLVRSQYKTGFFKLANQYQIQPNKILCGPTTGAIVLNSLRYNSEKAPLIEVPQIFLDQMPVTKEKKFEPRIRAYTPDNFLNKKALKIKSLSRIYAGPVDKKIDPGLQLEQLRQILEKAHGTEVRKIVVGSPDTKLTKTEADKIIAEMKRALKEKDTYVVVNYARSALKQVGGGHISPVGAYDEQSDSFLVMDTNPAAGPWLWVASEDLLNAMNSFDTVENRGVLIVHE